MNAVNSFQGQFRFLSNFWASPIVKSDGFTYPTAEHAYQACKFNWAADRAKIRLAPSPADAKRLARKMTLRPDWDRMKVDAMGRVLRLKFTPGSELAAMLLETGDAKLIEGNTWGDTFWGVCNGQGKNILGNLLMDIREELRLIALPA